MCQAVGSLTKLNEVYGLVEIDRALDEYEAMGLFQAKEMVRYSAAGRAAEYRTLEWQGKYLRSEERSNSVGYWGGDEWYLREPGDEAW